MNTIGIRFENRYEHEKRVPLVPKHVKKLIAQNIPVIVESSAKRIFADNEFTQVGAEVCNDISKAPVIFGVKEVPIPDLLPDKTYIFFSHVIKGQAYNMPMLKKMMELNCTLIDYEKITDEFNKRIIFFGKYAGLAGMINTMWTLGKRLERQGIHNPFERLKQCHRYQSLREAKNVISEIGFDIMRHGLPAPLTPLVFGITGYGNVSSGSQEILHMLPVKEISPDELLMLGSMNPPSANIVYKVVFKEKHMFRHKYEEGFFDLQDYYQNPQNYESNFDQYVPLLSVLVHGSYWDTPYPRIMTKSLIKELSREEDFRLKAIGDISCDIQGGIEFTMKATEISDPVFVYNPETEEYAMGFEGDGIPIMAVDILPSELPRDASESFSDALFPFAQVIAKADFSKSFEEVELPAALKRATILYHGELTENFNYLKPHVAKV